MRNPRFSIHLAAVVTVAVFSLALPATALADATVDFEGFASETVITNQYADLGGAGQGVVFGPLPGAGGNGFRPVIKTPPAGEAQSGTRTADISFCNNGECGFEFYPPVTTGTFQTPKSKVSVRVGLAGAPGSCTDMDNRGCALVTLQAYSSNGDPIGTPSSATVYSGAGFHTLLSVEMPSATIRGFKVSARSDLDLNEPVGIDDVTFDLPVTSQPPPPPRPSCVPPTDKELEGRRVSSPAELVELLHSEEFSGRIIIPGGVNWEMTGYDSWRNLPVRSGVEIIGERGTLGRRPLLYTNNPAYKSKDSQFRVIGNDVRIEGLHIRGPKPAQDHKRKERYFHGITVVENAEQELGRRVVIADNEFDQWTGGAVSAEGGHESVPLKEWKPGWQHLDRRDAGLVRIEGNYFHHNVMDDGGYGVVVGGGAYATIEGNVFDFNRHAVAADGRAHSGYIARHNYVLEGGVKQHANNLPDYYNQHFDVHGELKGGYGGHAGTYFEIAQNTIRGEQEYYYGRKTRPAFMLRGRPTQGAHFRDNVLVHDDLDEAVSLKPGKIPRIGDYSRKLNFRARGNRFGRDYSTELAAGDFDGDCRTDAFLANGTGWFFSRAGISAWEYLGASSERTHELGFADIDNDGVTDVLWRLAGGQLRYASGGTGGPVALGSSPVEMKHLRFGDFDGDALTDIFYTRGGQWRIWYGDTRTWTPAQTSSIPISELLFGEFDEVPGTDVVAATGGAWSYSSAATEPWATLNDRLVGSFAKAVAADFDGNGKSDIGFGERKNWRYSADGRSALFPLRSGGDATSAPLYQLPIGRFDGGAQAKVLSFGSNRRLRIWNGLGSGNALTVRSLQNMG